MSKCLSLSPHPPTPVTEMPEKTENTVFSPSTAPPQAVFGRY